MGCPVFGWHPSRDSERALKKPWVNGKGDLKYTMEYESTYSLEESLPDATHVRLPENIDEKKEIRQEELMLFLPTFR